MMTTFHDLLQQTQSTLKTRLTEDETIHADDLMPHLFYSGYSLGLTTKEIIQALLKPVANELRPGLTRP